MTDYSMKCPTITKPDCAEGEYYDDLITQFGPRLSPPKVINDVQHAIEAINDLGMQGPQGPQGPQGDTGAQGPTGMAGVTDQDDAAGPIAFNQVGFTLIPGYPVATIPAGASGGTFYVEANHCVQSATLSGESAFFDSIINHTVSGNLGPTQKSVNLSIADGPEGGTAQAEFNVNLSTISQLPAGDLTVFGNTGGSQWDVNRPSIHFFQLSS